MNVQKHYPRLIAVQILLIANEKLIYFKPAQILFPYSKLVSHVLIPTHCEGARSVRCRRVMKPDGNLIIIIILDKHFISKFKLYHEQLQKLNCEIKLHV